MLLWNDAGLTLTFVMNTLSVDFYWFFAALRPSLVKAAADVSVWPRHDPTPSV